MTDQKELQPLLLVHDSPGCSHKFVDSVCCLKCGTHCSDLKLEEADEVPQGSPVSIERAQQILRFVFRFGEPMTEAGRARLAVLRERVAGAPQ